MMMMMVVVDFFIYFLNQLLLPVLLAIHKLAVRIALK